MAGAKMAGAKMAGTEISGAKVIATVAGTGPLLELRLKEEIRKDG